MEETNTTVIIITAVATLVTSLGIPQIWKMLGDKQKFKSENEYKAKISALETRITQIVSSVDLLLVVIQGEFENNDNIKEAIDMVKETLHKND